MELEIFVGAPSNRIVTKSALLAYYDEETADARSAARRTNLDAATAGLSACAPELARFVTAFNAVSGSDTRNLALTAVPLGSSISIHTPWECAKEALRGAKSLACEHGLLFYNVNTEEWLNATRPCEEHRAGTIFTSERGSVTYLARHDVERLTDLAWFGEEAQFGFALSPQLTMQAKALAGHYIVECRLGSSEHEFTAETTRLSKVRDALERFYEGDLAAFSQLEFRRSHEGSQSASEIL